MKGLLPHFVDFRSGEPEIISSLPFPVIDDNRPPAMFPVGIKEK
ncbi:MAG: hypothetical protein ABFD69_16165 [Candidatus Sumerlaeia bacterium]